MYKLIIEDDEGKTTVVPLIRDEISIGRKEGNTIRLTERNVSRRHARLVRQNGAVYIEDLTSHNGIKVNGDRIVGRAAVGEGDRIQIGDYQLSVKVDRSADKGPQKGGGADDLPQTTQFVKPPAELGGQATLPPMGVPTTKTAVLPPPPEPQPQPERPARLIVISQQFYKQEFVLDKAAIVIGRTDENDVVVNHRSISRHHAKIVREGGHYHIVDLQSANGVRVNGEEYGKVELRKGDHIDLGHVRLVFVPAGQDVEIGKPVKTDGGTKRPALLLFFIVLCLIGGITAAVKYLIPMVGAPGGGRAADADSEAAKILGDVEGDLQARRWDDAIGKAERVLQMQEASQQRRGLAAVKKDKAEQEKRIQGFFERFTTAAGGRNFDEALHIYKELPATSVYQQMAKEHYDQIFPLFATAHLQKAEVARGAHNCPEWSAEVQQVLDFEPKHLEAMSAKAKLCEEKPERPERPTTSREPGGKPGRPGRPGRPETPAVEPGKREEPVEAATPEEVDTLLKEAQNHYVNADYPKAIELARKATRSGATSATRAWRIIGGAACLIKDLKLAGDAYRHLQADSRQFIVYVCQRNGVAFSSGNFKLVEQ